jgi:predicted DNA-binding transcriptional regulator AlpA
MSGAFLIVRSDHSEIHIMTDYALTYTTEKAATMLGLSPSTLAKLRLNGQGPTYCKLGRRVAYRKADLEQWLQSRLVNDTADADARFLQALTKAHARRTPRFSS